MTPEQLLKHFGKRKFIIHDDYRHGEIILARQIASCYGIPAHLVQLLPRDRDTDQFWAGRNRADYIELYSLVSYKDWIDRVFQSLHNQVS